MGGLAIRAAPYFSNDQTIHLQKESIVARKPEIGNVVLYPNRPLRASDKNGFVLKFYCPIRCKRIRKNSGTRDRREARKVLRECQERLLSGEYAKSDGAITKAEEERLRSAAPKVVSAVASSGLTWDAASERYRNHCQRRRRGKSTQDSDSRVDIASRIFEARRANGGLPPGVTLKECMTLEAMECLQDQLLDGTEGRYDFRSPNTVNSMMAAVMAFVRYCYDHEWIGRVPPVKKIDVDEVMRGRPITGEEFDRMLAAVPKVVGAGPAESWRFTLRALWESGFRIADVMQFSWDDERKIHPIWPSRSGTHPTIVIPSTQKNKKVEEIPILPGLREILETVPVNKRSGFVVNPLPIEYEIKSQKNWFMPLAHDLQNLIEGYSNVAIANACGVKETTVRNWLSRLVLRRNGRIAHYGEDVPPELIQPIRRRAVRRKHQRSTGRLTPQRVSEIIVTIGKEARVIVRQLDEETGQRIKYASAHDLRRSLAERLINAGISAETLMVIMRHKDFATTRKFYAARRAAQSAAAEIHGKLTPRDSVDAFVGG